MAPVHAPPYATDNHGREIEQNITIELLRLDDHAYASPEQLELRLQVSSAHISDALHRLHSRGVINIEGNDIELQDKTEARKTLDSLAAVVVHFLVSAYPRVLTLAEVAKACKHDLVRPDGRHDLELALRWIASDQLATHRAGWIATHQAVRAAELSHF